MKNSTLFFNRCFDKTRLKYFILWFFNKYGANETVKLVENLKNIGFQYATKTGISLGIDDLKIPLIKTENIEETEEKIKQIEVNYKKGNITEIERKQQFVEEWNFASDKLKTSVIKFFKATNIFNSIYMIAFSGARGNISQVRQLVGMRGLMVDPQGQVLEFPIRSNFREGLNLTEYIISCYGARKGVVDTALRTATSGYLTRRLVDVTQQVIIGKQNCKTNQGIQFTSLIEGDRTLLPLKNRIVGRILLDDIFETHPIKKIKKKIGIKNQEISSKLSLKITRSKKSIVLRSPLCCNSKNFICQLCYGWSLAHSTIVSIGEAVGVLAAQSIGEPGTQLTMRTFHTGGVFTGGFIDQICAPFNGKIEYLNAFQGKLIRTLNGQIGFLAKTKGRIQIKRHKIRNSKFLKKKLQRFLISTQLKNNLSPYKNNLSIVSQIRKIELNLTKNNSNSFLIFNTPIYTTFLIRHGCDICEKNLIAELSSPSFFKNRQHETEEELFAPDSGQIFFENLILIEKNSREGIIQKITYGLGSIWLIAGFFINIFFSKRFFPIHGDFLGFGSTSHKIKILIERFFEIDLQLLYLSKKIINFYKRPFTLKENIYLKENKLFNNIFFSRSLFSLNFSKIYYQDFGYVILKNFQTLRPNLIFYNKLKIIYSSSRIKKKYFDSFKNWRQIGLNFSFLKKNTEFPVFEKILNSELIFLFSSRLNLKKNFYSKFFFRLKNCENIKSKIQKPIISRKKVLIDLKNITRYQIWFTFTDSNIFKNKKFSFYSWSYYLKNSTKPNLYFELNKSSIKYLQELKTINTLLEFKDDEDSIFFKNFLLQLDNKKFTINLLKSKETKFLTQYSWISHYQICFNLVNRQGVAKFQLFNSYQIIQEQLKKLKFRNIFLGRLQTLKNNLFFPFLKKNLNKKITLKPIFFNLKNIKDLCSVKIYPYCYISQYFLILNQLEYLPIPLNKHSKSNNHEIFKIGDKTQFRCNIVPCLNYNHQKKSISLYFKENIFKKILFTCLNKYDQIEPTLIKKNCFLTWVCFSPIDNILKLGSFFYSGIRFDNHEILLDLLHLRKKELKIVQFYKNQLKTELNVKWVTNFQTRFQKKVRLISTFIIFNKKILSSKDNFKNLLLTRLLSNKIFFNLITFNIKKNYYNCFSKKPLKLSIFKNPFSFNHLYPKYLDKIFFKTEYIINTTIKFYLSQRYFIFIGSYLPITQISKNYKIEKTISNTYNKLFTFDKFEKKINVSLIKKFNFKLLNNQVIKKQNLLKIFHLRFELFCFKNEVQIIFFINFKNGEVICTGQKGVKTDFILISRLNLKVFFINKRSKNLYFNDLVVGNFLRYGDKINNKKIIIESGQIIYIDEKKLIIRIATPFLLTSRSILNVYQNEVVEKNSRLFKFLYHQIKTGDIVQGIPKIEELFEARTTRSGIPLLTNLHYQCKQIFRNYCLKFSIYKATQKSFAFIQKLIIDEIQKIYCSQGVYIADKHLEIVVRQMTSKVQIIDGGKTGLLCGELIEFYWASSINQKLKKQEILYEPIVLGITKSCLETESFISAASFQETTRILSKAAIQNKIDFIRGLKQNVILGSLIPAGTGFFSPLYFKNIND